MFSIIPVFSALVVTLLVGIAFPKKTISAVVSSLILIPALVYFGFTDYFDIILSLLVIFLCSFVFTEFTDSMRKKLLNLFGVHKPASRKKKK